MTKSKQINIAKEILTVLKIADPNSVLAGGAVRDWRILDIAGRDLDFYTSLPAHRSEEQIQELIASALMGTNVRKLETKKLRITTRVLLVLNTFLSLNVMVSFATL